MSQSLESCLGTLVLLGLEAYFEGVSTDCLGPTCLGKKSEKLEEKEKGCSPAAQLCA